MNSAKDGGQTRQFQWLHGASVVINLFQLTTFFLLTNQRILKLAKLNLNNPFALLWLGFTVILL